MKTLLFTTCFLILLISAKCYGQQLVYTPKNPAFGGNPYNYSWMLSSAEAQNTYKAPVNDIGAGNMYATSSAVDDFAESLNRQILSRLSRELVTRQFGEDALEEGSYVLGDYQIDIGDSDTGIGITIVDNKTGATTTVEVPYF